MEKYVLQQALEEAVRKAEAPGAVALVGRGDEILFEGAAGLRQRPPTSLPASTDTLYDLASLTKVICTLSVVMQLRAEGKLRLDQPMGDFVPLDWGKQVSIRQVLTHTAGLPPLLPGLRDRVHSLAEGVAEIAKVELRSEPGTRRVYSDLGFITLAQIVELIERDTFDAVCAKRIFKPLGLTRMGFKPSDDWKKNCAATEACPWRKKVMVGEVHDENAWAMGGVSGHAGLFGTAGEVGKFCAAYLAGKVLPKEVIDEIATLKHVPFYPWQAIGWKIDPWDMGLEGHLASRNAIGHTGWTGTSLWMDRDSGIYAVLLSNTCHPSREARDNRTLRQVFHRAVNAQLYPTRANVHTGLDAILWNEYDNVKNKRTGLLTHLAAVDQLGRDSMEVFGLRPEQMPRRIFTPEHGLRGAAEAGEHVSGERAATEVVSLYGEQKAPTPAQLADIDLFVVNLQDIGARYYTYLATMKGCLEACARAKKPVLVLDRPNPLGGEVLEGPFPEHTDSLVCAAKVPIRHGMSMGELAMFLKEAGALKDLDLQVVEMDGWRPGLPWEALGLPWVPPSPNIPTPETALVYVGMCLFEGVNLNEGRGTETPFYVCGAPWVDPEKVLARVPAALQSGARLEAVEYTPRSIPGKAAKPVHMDAACRGIKLTVTDAGALRSFGLACGLLRALHEAHPGKLEFNKHFDVLAGGPELRKLVTGKGDVQAYLSSLEPLHRAYNEARPRLY